MVAPAMVGDISAGALGAGLVFLHGGHGGGIGDTALAVGLLAAGLVLVGGGVWWMRTAETGAADAEPREGDTDE